MKKLTCCLIALASINAADAGPEIFSTKDVSPAPTPPPPWYRDHEWNISAWFALASPGTDDNRSSLADTFSANPGPGTYDRFLADDHAFGGGAEVKYFFRRYFGIGIAHLEEDRGGGASAAKVEYPHSRSQIKRGREPLGHPEWIRGPADAGKEPFRVVLRRAGKSL